MVLTSAQDTRLTGQIARNSCASGAYEATWTGFVYMPGLAAGAESVGKYLETLPGALYETPKGIYFLNVLHKPSGTRYAFVDSGAFFHAFVSDEAVSDSFLTLAKQARMGREDFDAAALIEFVHFGYVFWGKTLFKKIRRIQADEIIRIDASGAVESLRKGVPDIALPPRRSMEESIGELISSLALERVSVDLTGGMDSRLLVLAVRALGLKCELALSGVPSFDDIAIAQTVAEILGCELNLYYHDLRHFDSSVEDAFEVCDGLCNPFPLHRSIQFQQARLQQGITVAMGGAGGELFRDRWWQQDFPFYRKPKPNLNRMYKFYVCATSLPHSYLAPRYRIYSEQFRQQFFGSLRSCEKGINSEVYDRVFYTFKTGDYGGRSLTNNNRILPFAAPFLDRDLVAYAYALPRRQRMFDLYHRRKATEFSARAARVQTTSPGSITMSSRPIDIATDLVKWAADRSRGISRRLARKLAGKVPSGRNRFRRIPNHPDLPMQVLHLAERRQTLQRLKDCGIIDPSVDSKELTQTYWGNFIALDLLLDSLAR